MPNFWSSLVGKAEAEKRMSVDDWMMAYNGHSYPLIGSRYRTGSKMEDPDADFATMVNAAYKANGAVFATCYARQLIFTEARFALQRLNKGRPGDLRDSKALDILRSPWANGTTGDLLMRMMQDADLSGNAYYVEDGPTLRRLRPDWVSVVLSAAPDQAVRSDIVGYIYKPGNTTSPEKWETYPVDGSKGTVVHWAPIPDPDSQYIGMSWLSPVMREILADKAATQHKLKYFDNATVPGLAVALKDTVTKEQFTEFMEAMDTKSGVDNAYSTLYLGGGADVTVLGANMQQMDFRSSQGINEARIAAAGHVPLAIVGFSEGQKGSSMNGGNYREAKDQFAEGTLRPLWRSLCSALEPLVADKIPQGTRLWYDDRDIAFLRADLRELADLRNKEANTIGQLIMAGYTPDSVITAVQQDDWGQLTHTGLFSVQLMPPGTISGATTGNHSAPSNGGAVLSNSNQPAAIEAPKDKGKK